MCDKTLTMIKRRVTSAKETEDKEGLEYTEAWLN